MEVIIFGLIIALLPTIVTYIAYRGLSSMAIMANLDAKDAKRVAEETHKIVNSQRTAMVQEIDNLKLEVRTLKDSIEKLKDSNHE